MTYLECIMKLESMKLQNADIMGMQAMSIAIQSVKDKWKNIQIEERLKLELQMNKTLSNLLVELLEKIRNLEEELKLASIKPVVDYIETGAHDPRDAYITRINGHSIGVHSSEENARNQAWQYEAYINDIRKLDRDVDDSDPTGELTLDLFNVKDGILLWKDTNQEVIDPCIRKYILKQFDALRGSNG